MIESIGFATGNNHKLQEAQLILGISVEKRDVDLDEIQAVAIEDLILHKAKSAYEIFGEPVLVEDTGLFIKAWKDFPGALIKWMLQTVDNEGIIDMLKSFDDRSCYAKTIVAYWDGKQLISGTGILNGTISTEPRGTNGFGWDKIFIPEGVGKTFAEMDPSEKNKISMRKIAFSKLKEKIAA